jgi:hypothetical protein
MSMRARSRRWPVPVPTWMWWPEPPEGDQRRFSDHLARFAPTNEAAEAAISLPCVSAVLMSPATLSAHVHRAALIAALKPGHHHAHMDACHGASRPDAADGSLALLHAGGIGPVLAASVLGSWNRMLTEADLPAVMAWAGAAAGAAAAALPILPVAAREDILRIHATRGSLNDSLAYVAEQDLDQVLAQRHVSQQLEMAALRDTVAVHIRSGSTRRDRNWSGAPTWQLLDMAADAAHLLTDADAGPANRRRWDAALAVVDSFTGSTATLVAGIRALH